MKKQNAASDILFGTAVGDALGVPVEFESRHRLQEHPVTGMTGHGTHGQPAGTWSDDSALTFCLAEALTGGFNLEAIGEKFKDWLFKDYWTPYGEVFDVGNTTMDAIHRMADGTPPEQAGGTGERSNGNGALMRILPLLLYIHGKPIKERWEVTRQVSSITHGHPRSVIACFYYLEFASGLLEGKDKFEVYRQLQHSLPPFLTSISADPQEIARFDPLLKERIDTLTEENIRSSGYVLNTLEAAIWCLLTTDTYKDAVLKAVNLGEDTDTTGAVTGGLAGLLYGYESIPEGWIRKLARRKDIADLASRMMKTEA